MSDEQDINYWPKKCGQMNNTERGLLYADVVRISDALLILYTGATERVIKSLFLINSGGIITILAYIYRGTSAASKNLLNYAFIMFLVGLILAFALVILDYFTCERRSKTFSTKIKELYEDQMTPSQIPELNGIHPFPKVAYFPIGIGILSGIAIAFGIFFGLKGFLLG